MPTPTINYAFNLPTPGGDDDVWGDLLNDNWTDLDAQLFNGTIGADTTGNAATATLATLATSATALDTARTVTIGATGKAFDGSADVSWDLAEIGLLFADQVEAEAGTDNTKLMTPLRTAEAIAELVPAPAPPSTSEVLDATAGASFGAVGTYAFLYRGGLPVIEGATYAGSELFPAGFGDGRASSLEADAVSETRATRGGVAVSGTWRAMGRVNDDSRDDRIRITLFLRIS
jgi:hypothetical protein